MRVRRRPILDEYVQDGVAAVLVGDHVMVLSALATELVRRIEPAGTDVEILAKGLVETFGLPPDDPDGVASTRAAVKDLADRGIVEIDEVTIGD